MTKLEQARRLLAEATPGPWSYIDGHGWFSIAARREPTFHAGNHDTSLNEDDRLVYFAVRQYAALLDVVEAARGIHVKTDRDGKPVIIGMLALSEATRKWEES